MPYMMASDDLKEFLRSIEEDYVQYAESLHKGTFTKRAELSAADEVELEALTVPKGAAGLINKAAQEQIAGMQSQILCYSPNHLLLLITLCQIFLDFLCLRDHHNQLPMMSLSRSLT